MMSPTEAAMIFMIPAAVLTLFMWIAMVVNFNYERKPGEKK